MYHIDLRILNLSINFSVKVEDFESTYDRAAASVLDVESSSNCTASTSVASPNSTSLTPMINELKMKQGKGKIHYLSCF